MTRAAVTLALLLTGCGRTAVYEPMSEGADGGCGAAQACVEVAGALDGLRWELPCVRPYEPAPQYVCVSAQEQTTSVTLSGAVDKRYEVTLRLRGVVETKAYTGGSATAPITRGGTPVGDAWNIYRLDVSSPPQRWHLNSGTSGLYYCRTIDEVLTVEADGRAQFTLFASTVDSNRSEIRNHGADGGALLVPGLGATPFDGQFIQLDVESVRLVP